MKNEESSPKNDVPPSGNWWQRFSRWVVQCATKVCDQVRSLVQRVVRYVQARLETLDSVKIQQVLVTCAIPATIALVILALAKLSPVIIVLLAVLALSALLQLWTRLLTLH